VTQQEYEDSFISNQFEEEDAEDISDSEPKRKMYDLRSRANGSKVDTFVQAKKTNAPVKPGSKKETWTKTDQQ
jgi:hypothetical protein